MELKKSCSIVPEKWLYTHLTEYTIHHKKLHLFSNENFILFFILSIAECFP